MTTPSPIEFVSSPGRIQLSDDQGRWLAPDGRAFETDMEAAQFVQEGLDLTEAMPHDSRNVIVESAAGFGTVTSKKHPVEIR